MAKHKATQALIDELGAPALVAHAEGRKKLRDATAPFGALEMQTARFRELLLDAEADETNPNVKSLFEEAHQTLRAIQNTTSDIRDRLRNLARMQEQLTSVGERIAEQGERAGYKRGDTVPVVAE